MKLFKNMFAVIALIAVLTLSNAAAFAETIGVVDLDKVVNNYKQAQDVSAELKVKEAELQKFLADAQKKLKNTSTPVERKNLEEKLTKEFKKKSESFRSYQVNQMKAIEKNVFDTIDKVAKEQKIDVVLNKATVLKGGADLTDKILMILNSKK